MKTILCPVDFTPKSDRLLNYVTSLARDRNGKIFLVSTQETQKKELVLAGAHKNEVGKLEELHDFISGVQGVPCGIVDESISGNLYKKLGNIADNYDIMAMPIIPSASEGKTKNVDLHKVIQDTLAPILVIPDHFHYQKIKRLLYAYDYKHETEPPIMQLNWVADWFNAEMVFITLMPGDTSVKEESKWTSIQFAIKNSWHGQKKISFETIVYPNLPNGLEHYLGLSHANDLLVLSINHQNILERVWYKRVVKGVLQYAKHPYLIIHE